MVERKKHAESGKQAQVHSQAESRAEHVASALPHMNKGSIPSDVNGSYTGTAEDDLYPVQDADDL